MGCWPGGQGRLGRGASTCSDLVVVASRRLPGSSVPIRNVRVLYCPAARAPADVLSCVNAPPARRGSRPLALDGHWPAPAFSGRHARPARRPRSVAGEGSSGMDASDPMAAVVAHGGEEKARAGVRRPADGCFQKEKKKKTGVLDSGLCREYSWPNGPHPMGQHGHDPKKHDTSTARSRHHSASARTRHGLYSAWAAGPARGTMPAR